jgi:hypothetical protein
VLNSRTRGSVAQELVMTQARTGRDGSGITHICEPWWEIEHLAQAIDLLLEDEAPSLMLGKFVLKVSHGLDDMRRRVHVSDSTQPGTRTQPPMSISDLQSTSDRFWIPFLSC